MGSTPSPDSAPSPEFLAAFRERSGISGQLSFAEFMELAMYDPQVGYYRQRRQRIGYGGDTDFFTATTSGALFGELVVAAVENLLAQQAQRAADFTFVEIGTEPAGGILRDVTSPFGASRCVPLGEPIELSGPCIVFSNELFDAQPFRRFVRVQEDWLEVFIAAKADKLAETLGAPVDPVPALPPPAPPGYRFDAPCAAATLATAIATQPWHGLFLALDYGKSWLALATETPAGTARAYYRHRQVADLLARPGEQDLTCHICWDWLAQALSEQGFTVQPVLAQEAFLVTHSAPVLARITASEASGMSQRKLSLLQLLHPAHLGRKFQVLSAWRGRV